MRFLHEDVEWEWEWQVMRPLAPLDAATVLTQIEDNYSWPTVIKQDYPGIVDFPGMSEGVTAQMCIVTINEMRCSITLACDAWWGARVQGEIEKGEFDEPGYECYEINLWVTGSTMDSVCWRAYCALRDHWEHCTGREWKWAPS